MEGRESAWWSSSLNRPSLPDCIANRSSGYDRAIGNDGADSVAAWDNNEPGLPTDLRNFGFTFATIRARLPGGIAIREQTMPAEVQRLELSGDGLRKLSPERRYVFALTGHIFNELMLLQKWIHIGRMAPGNPGPQQDAAVAISMFLLRLLAAKTHEALDALKKQSVSDVLRADYFANVDGLTEQWDATLQAFSDLPWLRRVRNRGAFHYLNCAQWTPVLNDEFCEGAYMYVGKRYADTYFHWSEMAASLPSMLEVNANQPFEGLDQMLHDLGDLLGQVTDCLALGTQSFIASEHLVESLGEAVRFNAPVFEPTALHYFFADERIKE